MAKKQPRTNAKKAAGKKAAGKKAAGGRKGTGRTRSTTAGQTKKSGAATKSK